MQGCTSKISEMLIKNMLVAVRMIFGKDAEEVQKKLEQVEQRLNELASLVKESEARSEQRFQALDEHSGQLSEQLVRGLENITDELRAVGQARLDVEKS